MHRAVWPAMGGYFFDTLVKGAVSAEDQARLAKHFDVWVRAQGPLPTIRVGNQPYGVLPVTSLNDWRFSPKDAEGAVTLVTLRLPSDVSCIEQAVELVTRHCLAGHITTRTIRFRLQVVLSEALANAILRGNRESLDKWVDVRAELHEDVIRVHVTDEGPGFDPESVPEPIRPEQLDEAGGRGLFLIRKLVDAVQFNEQGNSICMILRRP